MPSTTRRWLLRAVPALVGLPALGGCAALDGSSATELRELYAQNNRDSTLTLAVRVSADGEVVHETSVRLPPDDLTAVQCAWPASASTYTVAGRIEGEPWRRYSLESGDAECPSVEVLPPPNDVLFKGFTPCPTDFDRGAACE